MGILDELLASVTDRPAGDQQQPQARAARGGGMNDVMMALLPVVLGMLGNRRGGTSQQTGGQATGGGLGGLLAAVLGGGAGGGAMGGLGDLLAQFRRAGFGVQADSWVSREQNMPLPANGIEQVFGRDGLAEIARRTGLSEGDASRGLSQLLPEVVDRVTPEGQIPQADALVASVEALGRRYGLH